MADSPADRAWLAYRVPRRGRHMREFRSGLLPFLYGLAAVTVSFACTVWAINTVTHLTPRAPMPDCPSGTRMYAEAVGTSGFAVPVFHCFNPEDRADVGDAGSDHRTLPH